ncbi:MAG: hypothetical protein CK429_28875 [Mycobacterium sp.]|nr:MAG: hypothetical protein CK429_28875 [Mycobacterium sp.]
MRRVLPPVVVLLVVLTGCGNTSSPRLWGAFTERGVNSIAMKPGRNVGMFTGVNLDAHGYIKYDKASGRLALEPGSYRVDGWSLTTFGFTPEQRAVAYSAPGNAFLWNVDKNDVEILASVADPLDSSPSIINGVLRVERTTQYYFGHQNGDKVDGISLETPAADRAFAQLVIERL